MSQALQQKNNNILFKWLLLVLLGSGVLFYVLMRMQAHHMQQKQLQLNQAHYIIAFSANPAMPKVVPGEYSIAESNTTGVVLPVMGDTTLFDVTKSETLPFTTLTSSFTVNGKTYLLTTYVSATEISHLIIKVFLCEVCILLLLFLVIMYINKKMAGFLWAPFRATMQQLGEYDITGNNSLALEKETGITEFNELNAGLTTLIERNRRAYLNQKQFVENASHEMQTPLSIIRSKLELLINQREITEDSAHLLADITDANDRLSEMNKNLLLLAKIENNQFPERRQVDVKKLLYKTIESYRLQYQQDFPLINIKAENITAEANYSLMEILVGNLIKNAVLHNVADGWVKISLSGAGITISNSGPAITVNPTLLFNRFSKGSNAAKSTGLGLSLVQQICQLYGFKPSYTYNEGVHTVTILF